MRERSRVLRRAALVAAGLAAASLAAASPALAGGHHSSKGPSSSSHASSSGGGSSQGSSQGSSHGGKHGGKTKQTSPGAAAPVTAGRSGKVSVQGVVQAVWQTGVSVKLLDGSAVSVPVDRKTKVYIDGKPGRLGDVKPGSVLVASWKAGKPAVTLRFVRPS